MSASNEPEGGVVTRPTTWPATGPWAASSRIPYVALCLWAAVVVPLWWVAGSMPMGWHAHEMVIGVGSGALAAYVPTAQTSWTGREPSHGCSILVLTLLWVSARVVMLLPPGTLVRGAYALLLAAPLWWITALVVRDLVRAGRGPRTIGPYPCAVLAFCIVAGVVSGWFGSGLMTGAAVGVMSEVVVILFALLLAGVGGRMVPAFLDAAGDRVGLPVRARPAWARLPFLVPLGVAVVTVGSPASAVAMLIAGVVLAGAMSRWRLGYARYDSLAAMTLVAYAWLPVGLVLWGWTLLPRAWGLPVPPLTPVEASHVLTMGALTGLVVAVMARASARRGDRRLHVRLASLVGFVVLMVAVPVRLAGAVDASALMWPLGWAAVLLGHLPHLTGPLERPVFSARRAPAGGAVAASS